MTMNKINGVEVQIMVSSGEWAPTPKVWVPTLAEDRQGRAPRVWILSVLCSF